MMNPRTQRRIRRKRGMRKTLFGTPQRPRMAVYRSLKHIYVQIVDDRSGTTLASASSVQSKAASSGNAAAAAQVGKAIAEKAGVAGIQTVTFDRSGFRYHGRIKSLADAAREGGLKF
jgi:large subunit ribosomal protein L18